MNVKKVKLSGSTGDAAHSPLSREQSKEAASQFAAEHSVPLKLLRDVKVVQFGTPSQEYSTEENLVMVNYRSRWTDAPSKVVFESRVELPEGSEDEARGPCYNVYAIDTNEDGKKLRYPVSKGSSPDDVWCKVAERQKHVLLREKKIQDLGSSPGTVSSNASSPHGGKISPVDRILKKVSVLSNVWGLEKFGFIDLTCLKAMEGQPGVEDTVYKYVNEREGWVQEQVKLRNLLGQRGQKLRLKPRVSSGLQHSAGDKVVERFMESLVKKVCIWNQKVEAKLARQKDREKKKEIKQLEKEKKREERKLSRQQAKQAIVDDMELDGSGLMPPSPLPITGLVEGIREKSLSQVDLERIFEIWSLAHRFHGILGINMKDFPSIETMLQIYCQDSPVGTDGNICIVFRAMVDFLVGELCEDSMRIILQGDLDLKRVDFVPPTRNARMVTTTSNNWQDVLHRYLYTVAISAGVSGKEDLQYVNYPLENVHPYHIIDSITSGPTMLELVNGDLNLLLSDETEQRIVARRDALGLRRSIDILRSAPMETELVMKNDRVIRLILAKLCSISTESGGSLWDTCFLGPESSLEARLGYPMDVSHVLSRVECLVYQMEESCFNSFAADLFFACKILQTACHKGSTKIGSEKVIAQKKSVLNSMIEALKDLSNVYNTDGMDGLLQSLEEEGFTVEHPCSTRPRNILPPEGACFICWMSSSNGEFEACSKCKMKAHEECLEREWGLASLRSGNTEEKLCLLCCPSKISGGEYKKLPGRYGNLWNFVRSLHDLEFDAWTPSEKIELFHLVALLVSESPVVRDSLDQDTEMAKAVRTKLSSARQELKTLQQEIRKVQQTQEIASHRSMREAESKREKLIIRISKLEQESKGFAPSRMAPLGYDRNWNKYWSLPTGAFKDEEVVVIVEQRYGSIDVNAAPDLGCYRGMSAINSLLAYLNPKGKREKSLKEGLVALQYTHPPEEVENSKLVDTDNPIGNSMASCIEQFCKALTDYTRGLPDSSFHDVRGSTAARNAWNASVESIKSIEQCLAAVICLERMLEPSCFKVHWRLWAIPVPDPTTMKTLGAAWTRLENLKKAVKYSSNQIYHFCMLHAEDHGREEMSIGKFDEDQVDATITDQEMALQLDAELNQRRIASGSTRNWQILSPRDRSRRVDKNLRDVSAKYYGEDDQDDESPSDEHQEPEMDEMDCNTPYMSSEDVSSESDYQ